MINKIKKIHINRKYQPPDFKPSTRDINGNIPNCNRCKSGQKCEDHQVGGIPVNSSKVGLIGSRNGRKKRRLMRKKEN